ncbi:MAG: M23 family metallopeptidase [Candidatus Peribacteraceae bacterium]|nr:M23 family metallopeptidase [Candidatus Peribacteraceae bacterium]
MTKIVSRRKFGFSLRPLDAKKEPHPLYYVSQRSSFWIATLSLLAFVMGNMVGQHGWYLFWASVLGSEEIVYTGTVSPIEKVPNYRLWNSYGGNPISHTYRQVPSDAFVPLPKYTKSTSVNSVHYSVSFMGTYTGEAEGSGGHPGVDIRVPIGTPIRSIANGIVHEVKSGGGFGNAIVIRHPNVPDPRNPRKTTTLYSAYAHLNTTMVFAGNIVGKGEEIGTSGQTGFASGPHLHFQIDTEDAPWHPYWPFTVEEQKSAGMTTVQAVNAGLHSERVSKYTISPMLYVQANYSAVNNTVIAKKDSKPKTLLSSVEQRKLDRMKSRGVTTTLVAINLDQPKEISILSEKDNESNQVIAPSSVRKLSRSMRVEDARKKRIAERLLRARYGKDSVSSIKEKVNVSNNSINVNSGSSNVSNVSFHHDGSYSGREWEKVIVTLLDENGHTVINPNLSSDIYLRTGYGEAEFKPDMLKRLDFINGEATFYILPRGRRTIILQAKPFTNQSKPMVYEELVASN